ncbi:RNA pseudouridine synthase [Variovorax sp. J22R133]|uniref:RNA pseudouridine synthase n=1 Tax=Variovorax brevis TaxID=3053503 RepID=UPI0025790380|nr:RNA pseudouridine synthase [Variovorax sp. J22R133]MDM0114605.1 RNA pseudouridine synthase [Variovorax sp. J22R133]
MTDDPQDGVRLAKRVAALAGCSRREAELLIENGAVRVDGTVTLLPQARVQPAQEVSIEPGAKAVPVEPVSLLLHKPAGLRMEDAPALLVPANLHAPDHHEASRMLPRHVAGQRSMTPLESGASGLIIFTQEWRIERKLQEDAAFIEHEVMVDVTGEVNAQALAQLNRPPAKVSVGRQSEARTGLRFALKGYHPGQIAQQCDRVGVTIEAMKRIRIGRVPLAGLPPGQWRYLQPHERI